MILLLLRLAVVLVLATFLVDPHLFQPLFEPLTQNGAPAIYDRTPFWQLALAHLGIVLLAAVLATAVAVGMAIFVTRPAGREFLPFSRSLANIGQTVPPVAVLALAVPSVGFGLKPTLIALFLYGLLPIFENTLAGLSEVPAPVVEAARGMGMNARQRLLRVELPLALPVILEGVRISTIVNVGTATLGSTVAAKGLGEVIVAGLLSSNDAFILQGGLVVALMAILIYDALGAVVRNAARRGGLARTGDKI